MPVVEMTPTCDLSATALLAAIDLFIEKVGGMPHTLVVSPNDFFRAQELVEPKPGTPAKLWVYSLKPMPKGMWALLGVTGVLINDLDSEQKL